MSQSPRSSEKIPAFYQFSTPPPEVPRLLCETEFAPVGDGVPLLCETEFPSHISTKMPTSITHREPTPVPLHTLKPARSGTPVATRPRSRTSTPAPPTRSSTPAPSRHRSKLSHPTQKKVTIDVSQEGDEDSEEDEEEESDEDDELAMDSAAIAAAEELEREVAIGKIGKPTGETGRPGRGGYNLADAMNWEGERYKRFQTVVHKCADRILDLNRTFSHQQQGTIKRLCNEVAQEIPEIERYLDCWPVRDCARARLKYMRSRAKKSVK